VRGTVLSILLGCSLFPAPAALAQHETFQVIPDSSEVKFTLGDVLHTVHGTFHVQRGSIDFDRTAPKMAGSILVAAGSGSSGNESRDRKMSKDILDASHFAEASFAPHSYQGTIATDGDSTIQVAGTFTLHGTPHEMTVPVTVHVEGGNWTIQTHFSVPYVKWGLKDPSTFVLRVGKDVEIDLTLVGHLTPGSQAAP
jgi:polyisoprenoid-binding protein YceI